MAEAIVSIIVVNWNGLKFLDKCLSSIFTQKFARSPWRFEVVFVDNGSTDGSVEFVKGRFPAARVIENGSNLGFAKANNQGIAASGAKFVLTLNNDTELSSGFLDNLLQAANRGDLGVGMWAPKILSMETARLIDSVGGLLIYPDGLARGRGRLEKDTGQYDGIKEIFAPSACAALYLRTMLDSVGLFDEDYFAYCEDTDLGFRARLAGWKAVSAPEAVVYHYYSGTSGRYTPFKAYLVERNRIYTAIKNLPLSYLAASFFYTAWRYIVQAYGVFAGKGAGGRFSAEGSRLELVYILFKAYAHAAANLPSLLKKRSVIRQKIKATSADVRTWFRNSGIAAAALVLKD
ncbi:MAG: glycosyltransferase [Deltaproteobacteria bacterium]|nr:glycosyltransferase [Deltaproteobacteria bacterium]